MNVFMNAHLNDKPGTPKQEHKNAKFLSDTVVEHIERKRKQFKAFNFVIDLFVAYNDNQQLT